MPHSDSIGQCRFSVLVNICGVVTCLNVAMEKIDKGKFIKMCRKEIFLSEALLCWVADPVEVSCRRKDYNLIHYRRVE